MTPTHLEISSKTVNTSAETTTDHSPDERLGPGLTRRSILKSLTAAAGVAALLPTLVGNVAQAQKSAAKASALKLKGGNPRWYGFNLLEYFSTDPDWMKYFPYKDDGLFLEDDFRWMRD